MSSNMLVIPFRVTEPGNIGLQLADNIKQDFFQVLSKFQTDCESLQALRASIAVIGSDSFSKNDETKLLEYFAQLEGIKRKFPDDAICTKWRASLGYQLLSEEEYISISTEQLNIIFQLGALYSNLTSKESQFTSQGLKVVCSYYQQAAGCMDFLAHKTQSLAAGHIASVNTIKALGCLMKAQAQETIWLKAITDEMKDSIVAKLAMATSDLYSKADQHAAAKDSVLTLEWVNQIRIKKAHFKAAACLRKSTTCLDTFLYGEQVAYLQQAKRIIEGANKHTKYVPLKLLVDDLRGLTDTVQNTLRVAEKENDLVYLKVVPSEAELKPILGAVMVKSTTPALITSLFEELSLHFDIYFKDLLPYIVIQLAHAYRERQETFVYENVVEPLKELNDGISKILGLRNLPASIDSIQTPESIPDLIIRHSQEIISHGGTGYIDSIFSELTTLAYRANKILDGAKERLEMEKEEDKILRERYGWTDQWTRKDSSEASKDLVLRLSAMQQYLKQSKEGDGYLLDTYEKLMPFLELYCDGYKSLSKYIPHTTYVELNDELSACIVDLRNAINALNDLIIERMQYKENLVVISKLNNILEKIVREYKEKYQDEHSHVFGEHSFENIFHAHMHVFDESLEYVRNSTVKQKALEQQIDTLNTRFIDQVGSKFKNERTNTLQSLESAYSSYLDLISNLESGCKFYNNIIARGNIVLRDCDRYVYGRRMDGRDLENQIQILRLSNELGKDAAQPNEDAAVVPPVPVASPVPLRSPTPSTTWNPAMGLKFS